MLDQESIDNFVKQCGRSGYESLTSEGFKTLVEQFTLSLMEDSRFLDVRNINNALYIIKFLSEKWAMSDKSSRLKKQLCIKVLYIVLLSPKKISEWRKLLEYGAAEAGKNWEVKIGDYPYLTQKEKEKILSEVSDVEKSGNIDTQFFSHNSGGNLSDIKDDHDPLNVCKKLAKLFQKVSLYDGPENQKIRRLKAYFRVIKEKRIGEDYFGVLKALPLEFCRIQIERLISEFLETKEKQSEASSPCRIPQNIKSRHSFFIQSESEGEYEPLPEWAAWVFNAGQKAAMVAAPDHRIILGFSLPTIAYAALFFLLGHETWCAEKMMREQFGTDSYFNYLAKCQPDEPLLIRESNRWKRCWFNGFEEERNQKFIKVKVPGGERSRCVRLVPSDHVAILRKAVDPEREVAQNQVGFQMTGFDSMVSYYDKSEDKILEFLIQNRLSHFVIGNISSLKKEMENENLYLLLNENEYAEISFQDILRFKNFMTEFDLPRGMIVSSRKEMELLQHAGSPEIAVYNGSLAFINRQGDIDCPIEAIFIDPTESQFSNACTELMARYYDREDELKFLERMPSAVETIAFTE